MFNSVQQSNCLQLVLLRTSHLIARARLFHRTPHTANSHREKRLPSKKGRTTVGMRSDPIDVLIKNRLRLLA